MWEANIKAFISKPEWFDFKRNPVLKFSTKNMASRYFDFFSDIMKFSTAKSMSEETLKPYIDFLIKFFGKNGLKWFNTLDIQKRDNSFVFRGLHDMDEVYSNFFTTFYKYLISEYFDLDFMMKIEEKTSNLIHLEFKLK